MDRVRNKGMNKMVGIKIELVSRVDQSVIIWSEHV